MHFDQKKLHILIELRICLLIQIEYAAHALPRARFRPLPRLPLVPVPVPVLVPVSSLSLSLLTLVSLVTVPRPLPRPRPRPCPRPRPRPRPPSYDNTYSKPEGSLCVDRSYVRGLGEDYMVVAYVLERGVDSVIIKFLAPYGRPRPRTLIGS
jgi:hypothetical protein